MVQKALFLSASRSKVGSRRTSPECGAGEPAQNVGHMTLWHRPLAGKEWKGNMRQPLECGERLVNLDCMWARYWALAFPASGRMQAASWAVLASWAVNFIFLHLNTFCASASCKLNTKAMMILLPYLFIIVWWAQVNDCVDVKEILILCLFDASIS